MRVIHTFLLWFSMRVAAIETLCSAGCPANSFCSGEFCQCEGDYVLDCNVQAPFLTNELQTIELSNVSSMFQT